MRILERTQFDLFQPPLDRRFGLTLFKLSRAQLGLELVALRHVSEDPRQIRALLGRDLGCRRVWCRGAVSDSKDGAVGPAHDEVVCSRDQLKGLLGSTIKKVPSTVIPRLFVW